MVPLQFDIVYSVLGVVVPLVVAAAVFLVVFGLARYALPSVFRRLALHNGWSANGEAVLLAGANGAAATLAAVLALGAAGFGNRIGGVLVVGGVVTGVAVERRRRSSTSPVTELLALVAGLLAVGVATLATSSGIVRVVGVFLAGGAFGALARAGINALVASEDRGTSGSAGSSPADAAGEYDPSTGDD
ncbi:hypothetical protein [Halorarum halobium]|uniref:hypothetical protein n=1 Tax=Halorarum halobium TaxID=3075121 RepID=UPI0028A9C4AE|nr:hypothetical protein [Halobaculum sp. XH14]